MLTTTAQKNSRTFSEPEKRREKINARLRKKFLSVCRKVEKKIVLYQITNIPMHSKVKWSPA